MVEFWQIEDAKVRLRLARYLMVEADKRGLTHGEKHHFLFVAISLVNEAQFLLKDESHDVMSRNDEQELKVEDISF